MPAKLATQTDTRKCWRDVLKVHPAAELFPLMGEAELKELAEDIKNHGLRAPIIIWAPDLDDDENEALVDGRNRLDALELLGLLRVNGDSDGELCLNKWWNGQEWAGCGGNYVDASYTHVDDPYALALSYNVHRRHLTTEQKRELIAKVLKAKPEASNLQIAKQVKADDKTVAKVRANLESTSEIPKLEKTVGKDGRARKQPAKRKAAKPESAGKVKTSKAGGLTIDMVCTRDDDDVKVWSAPQAEVSVEQRRAEMVALANTAEDAKHEAAGKAHAKEEESADKPEHKAPSAKDIALSEFNNHVLRLLQITSKAKPERFAKTTVRASDLSQLGRFLAGVLHEDQDIIERALQLVQQMDAEQQAQFLTKLEATYGAEMPAMAAVS